VDRSRKYGKNQEAEELKSCVLKTHMPCQIILSPTVFHWAHGPFKGTNEGENNKPSNGTFTFLCLLVNT